MAYLTVPYNDSMQLGQGFNSLTHEIHDENVVSIERIHADATLTHTQASESYWLGAEGDAYECASEASAFTNATPTSSQWDGAKALPSVTGNDSGFVSVAGQDRKSPIVTFTSRSVDCLSEVTTEMNISAAVPIIHQSRNGSGAGLPFDVRHFYEADLNYYLGVRVVTRQDRPAAAFSISQGILNSGDLDGRLGFLEGGQLNALISVKLVDKKKSAEVSAGLDAILQVSNGKFRSFTGTVDTAMRTVMEHSKITVDYSNVGGGTITFDDQSSVLHSLRDVSSNFPDLAADQPERIFAILTKYDSLGGSQAPIPTISYDHCTFFANMLLDSFMEYKSIERRLSAQIAQIKSGTMQFQQGDDRKRRFDASWRGITRAKRECTNQMLKILKEVGEMKKYPDIATDDTRDEQFEDPLVFNEYLPQIVPTAQVVSDDDSHDPQAQLYHGNDDELFQAERVKVKEINAEHPEFASQLRMATPCGSEDAGEIFCSLDYLKPDWTLAEVSAYVARGVVSALSLKYTNGLVTIFGAVGRKYKLFNLKLDLSAKEHVVGCSIETGQPAVEKLGVCVTAFRLSTNRGSALIAQAHDWKEATEGGNGNSPRDGISFQNLKMTHYDPLLGSGYIQGFWGRASLGRTAERGFLRLAPIWGNATPPATLSGMKMDDALEGDEVFELPPSGLWDTWTIHDWESPVSRTSAILPYENTCPEKPLPMILTGFRKMDTWSGANLRFSATVDYVTESEFSIGVDQWSSSVFFGDIKFARSFTKPVQMLTWISGLDLDIEYGKRVDISATDISGIGFKLNVASASSALVQASISWIAIERDSGCAMGSYCCSVGPDSHEGGDGWCSFPEGKFSKPPKVLIGFSSFDISGSSWNPRFGTRLWDVTKDGFNWSVYTWDESAISCATVQWIAIPAE
ncbi:hypothetical protein BFW01_g10409 [Lasiodiplodia theobromae]|uniref:H-type lectin domain-containing protein n=1 Tax=Lasiodiplodia theobromae TaxID=45133 RepID=A0A8H7IP74_9PEZI|nr:hypothetical protein BFW01_g10409 [Lasiodiplodia theobromae]